MTTRTMLFLFGLSTSLLACGDKTHDDTGASTGSGDDGSDTGTDTSTKYTRTAGT